MDESTRNQLRKDIKSGHSNEEAARRAGISTEKAYYEADKARGEDFSKMMQDTLLKPSGSSGELPFGAIALVILCIAIWSNLGVIVQWAMIIGLFILMAISLLTTVKGMWTFVQLLWLTFGSALIAAVVLLFRSNIPNPDEAGILGARFPQLSIGSVWGDAIMIGFCVALLAYALPFLRDGLFRSLSAFGLTQALRVYVASSFSAWPLRILAQLLLLPLGAALLWILLMWPSGSWVMRAVLCYGLLLVAFAQLWVWRLTSEPGVFGSYFAHVDVRSYQAAWEKYGGKWKD